ncbi:hypothetical protein GKQ77_13565 [Streptomyces sp. BG9H]|uniref:Secreted protein n=1 Tax=Streptomyces anatolicus TaxID=2675858 RepID=A0ABS6YMD3_9ACTN|nr:hypothetical protein [Streptomyces anatolicus]MBW5422581.1 hypothetical protein [Streptomyces anatolicus]
MRAFFAVIASVALASAALTGEAVAASQARPDAPPHSVIVMEPCNPTSVRRGVSEGEALWYFDRGEDMCVLADTTVPSDPNEHWDNYGECWDRCG